MEDLQFVEVAAVSNQPVGAVFNRGYFCCELFSFAGEFLLLLFSTEKGMQVSVTIDQDALKNIVRDVFETGNPQVYEAYSEYGQSLRQFMTATDMLRHIEDEISSGAASLEYVVYYPDTKGSVQERRVTLDPKRCGGHTFRYSLNGLGVIQFQCDVTRIPAIQCRIAVNTQKRASAWSLTCPDMDSPSLWDWEAVKKHAGRIMRQLKNCAQSRDGTLPTRRG